MRLIAAQELGITEIPCLVSKDDEAYTYNAKVNRVVPVQANRMIVKAIEKGVRPERLARTLGVSLETVTRLMNLMEGICPEAVEILKDKPVAEGVFRELRKVTPLRQMAIADAMNSAGDYKASLARLMVDSSPEAELTETERERRAVRAIETPEDLARLKRELQCVEKDYNRASKNYSQLMFDVTLARNYLKLLLGNNRVLKYLAQNYKAELDAFQRIEQSSVAA
jgi:ParB-like chromosome segregation protein Spo0J